MALVTLSFRSLADATRRAGRAHVATAVPVKRTPDPLAAPVGEGTRREPTACSCSSSAPAPRATRPSLPQPPMCDISTRGRSAAVPCVRSSE